MILCVSLLQMKFLQLLDLENLPEQNEQAVLLDPAVTQKNFTAADKRIRIGNFPGSLKTALQFTLHDFLGTTGVFDDLVRKHITELSARSECRILCLWFHYV